MIPNSDKDCGSIFSNKHRETLTNESKKNYNTICTPINESEMEAKISNLNKAKQVHSES